MIPFLGRSRKQIVRLETAHEQDRLAVEAISRALDALG
jgi:exopolyphosphatase/pppGpp-phosphohydrolase